MRNRKPTWMRRKPERITVNYGGIVIRISYFIRNV